MLSDLLDPQYRVEQGDRCVLDLGAGWARRWMVKWKAAGSEMVCAVRDAAEVPVAACRPVRSFSWRTDQFHRPGLATMVSTRRLHGFESLNERKLLLALDFLGDVRDLLSQPMTLRFTTSPTGSAAHTPDFLAVTGSGV